MTYMYMLDKSSGQKNPLAKTDLKTQLNL